MVKIEEVRIPRGKEPIFIDYSQIYGDAKKRLVFLRALIQIINTRADFIQFEDLGLNPEDTKLFTGYLKKYYSKNFDPKKNSINLFENYDGKIICGIDLLIEDLFNVITNENEKIVKDSSKSLDTPPVQPENVDSGNQEQLLTYFIFEIFYDWVFLEKYEKNNFDSECKMYLTDFYAFSESELKKIFNINRILDEIYKNFKNSNIKKTNIVQIRMKLITCLEDLEKKYLDKKYWSELIIQTKKVFKNLIDATTISKNEKMKLFLTFAGDPHIRNINKAVSHYKNKTVLFEKDAPIFSSIEKNQIVQGEIKIEKDTSYIVKPIRIIDFNEAKMLLFFGIEACPTTEYVNHFLADNG